MLQVKGLQAEYSRVTAQGVDTSAADSSEAASLKLQLQRASQEKAALQVRLPCTIRVHSNSI